MGADVIDLTDDGGGATNAPPLRSLFDSLPSAIKYTTRVGPPTPPDTLANAIRYSNTNSPAARKAPSKPKVPATGKLMGKRTLDATIRPAEPKKRKSDPVVVDLEKENGDVDLFDQSRTVYGSTQRSSGVKPPVRYSSGGVPPRVQNHADFVRPAATTSKKFSYEQHLAKQNGAIETAERPLSAQERRMRNQMQFLQGHATVEAPKNMFAEAMSHHNRGQRPAGPAERPIEQVRQQPKPSVTAFSKSDASSAHASPRSSQTSRSAPHVGIYDEEGVRRPVYTKPEVTRAQVAAEAPDTRAVIEPMRAPRLCKEQKELVDLIMTGANVFYTGSAGCGKSTVLNNFVKKMKKAKLQVDIIAPTGRAALAINGSTTWTYAGITPDHHKKPLRVLKQNAHGKFVTKRIRKTDVLVIDEISMVENLHFERLNSIMKAARGDDRAFGGVQIIVTGDFCQLPPVKPFQHCITCGKELLPNTVDQTYKCPDECDLYKDVDKWAFRSKAWNECGFKHVNLTKIHRQNDAVFIKMLNKCRYGEPLLPKDKQLLLNHPCDVENAVKLFSTKEEVRRVNLENFNKLKTKNHVYPCLDGFTWNKANHPHLEWKGRRNYDDSLASLSDHRYDTKMELKEGMLVVLLVNLSLEEGLVNGSQGVIVGWEDFDPNKLPKAPRKDEGTAGFSSSGSLGGDYGMQKEQSIKTFIESPRVVDKKWPIVEFDNGVKRTIYADCTINELGDEKPYSLLSRTQIPLTAAWAMSIHKSQGMTLNKVVVDLSRSFEEGQMYVALSRARGLDGLKVEGLGKTMGKGNEQVKEFLYDKFNIMA